MGEQEDVHQHQVQRKWWDFKTLDVGDSYSRNFVTVKNKAPISQPGPFMPQFIKVDPQLQVSQC